MLSSRKARPGVEFSNYGGTEREGGGLALGCSKRAGSSGRVTAGSRGKGRREGRVAKSLRQPRLGSRAREEEGGDATLAMNGRLRAGWGLGG